MNNANPTAKKLMENFEANAKRYDSEALYYLSESKRTTDQDEKDRLVVIATNCWDLANIARVHASQERDKWRKELLKVYS